MKKYGIVMMRAQPFHLGHQAIINEILLDGLTPIIILGSSNYDRNINKNPLTFEQRRYLIKTIYPLSISHIIKSEDYEDWNTWYTKIYEALRSILGPNLLEKAVVYYNEKEVDRCSFTFKEKEYKNTFYTDLFKDEGFVTKKIKFPTYTDIKIDAHARDIRANLESKKHLLDARVYHTLKEWEWK